MQDAATLERTSGARTAARALTPEQQQKWDRDGYLILPQFFGPDIIDPINALIERLSDPTKRPQELANRIVVDLLYGPTGKQRTRLADAPPDEVAARLAAVKAQGDPAKADAADAAKEGKTPSV